MDSFAFLKAAREKVQQSTFRLNPFGNEESSFDEIQYMTMLDFLELGEAPRPAPVPPTNKPVVVKPPAVQPTSDETSSVKLHHPRPRRIPAHIDALACFEEMAQRIDCAEFVANSKGAKEPFRGPVFRRLTEEEAAAERAKWASFDAAEFTPRRKRERVFFPPEEKVQTQQASMNSSEGLACISPSFLDNFPDHAKRQALWGYGPRPEDLPRPSFVLTSATIRKVVPPSSPSPPLPFQNRAASAVGQSFGANLVHSSGAGPLDYYEEDFPNYSWTEHSSDFDDVGRYEEGNGHNFCELIDDESYSDEDDEYEECENYTGSEHFGYDADDDTFGAEDGSVYAPSPRASPNPFVFPCPYPSTGSLTYSSSPSPSSLAPSSYSGSSEDAEWEFSPLTDWTQSDVISDNAARLVDPICQTMSRLAIRLEVSKTNRIDASYRFSFLSSPFASAAMPARLGGITNDNAGHNVSTGSDCSWVTEAVDFRVPSLWT
ncbi:uncharacterized protein FOMMEDRAFT_164925 [Fomitiporia mediterranea MF3/22]|uniref:uncharacterized protein n=1 Tax=Fomitiporia mediterranea (strain MF3/22) TaxID=694068 RepID=UPI0004408895|nr:uncharacterized protein FOMMEDRAFT_164925 [Fomitiporia mediterranea MF3/22]EJD08246.1 hypothetical protein FOMMEDRAFT_164925 [Fomitiporia mediterranea MF3/22]